MFVVLSEPSYQNCTAKTIWKEGTAVVHLPNRIEQSNCVYLLMPRPKGGCPVDLKVAEELSGPDVGREGCKKLARLVSNVLQWVRKDYKSSPKTDTGYTSTYEASEKKT